IPSPLPLRVIQKSKTLDSAALATQERLTRYRFSQGETLRERYRIAIVTLLFPLWIINTKIPS
ncbi:MAG TPA: hypothetical protein VE944_09335, partial [Nostoc sp.]|uniref:hypothetical protein n=1 Tax=Nostoc sp. TaxID=1180 RepID=UPI002D51DE04